MFKRSFIIYYIKEKLLPETHFYSCRQTEIIIFKDLKLFLEECHHFLLILLTTLHQYMRYLQELYLTKLGCRYCQPPYLYKLG